MILQELHICSIQQSLNEGITLTLPFVTSTWAIFFPSLCLSDEYRWNDISLTCFPSISRSLRRLNVPPYPAGSFLVINSEQEARKRLEFYPGESQRTKGSQDLWPIWGIWGQRPPGFPRISAEDIPPAYLMATPFLNLQHRLHLIHTRINKNIKILFVQVISRRKLALHQPGLIPGTSRN